MVKVKYVGGSNYREITSADWTSVGFPEQGKTVWDRDNARGTVGARQVHELPEEAAQWLLDNEPKGDFLVLEDEPVSPVENLSTTTPKDTKATKVQP